LLTVFQRVGQPALNHTVLLIDAEKSGAIAINEILRIVVNGDAAYRCCGERNVTHARSPIRTGFVRWAFRAINGQAPKSNFAPILYRYDTGRRGISSAPT
jgi:hypothetical protein